MTHLKLLARVTVVGIVWLAAFSSRGDDWPQWRGPNRNGISAETGLTKQWPKEGPPLIWHVTHAGLGYSTPAVVGDRLYTLENAGLDDESVMALAVGDGKIVWKTHIGKVGNPHQQPNYPAARSTPTVDGDKLYALGSDGDLACIETASGKVVWRKSLRTDFEGKPGIWAYSESPLVDGDVLVCTPGGSTATIVALDKNSGKTIWECAMPGGEQAAYASMIVDNFGGVKQYVQFLQKELVGVDAKTGKVLWRYGETAKGSMANIPTPLADGGFVYSAAGKSGGGMVKLNVTAGTIDAEQVYFSSKLPTAIGGAVKIGRFMYGTNSNGLHCVDFESGKFQWSDHSIGPASICFADGRLYLHGENGDVALIEAVPDGYHELGRFSPPDPPERGQPKAWAYPVVADGRLYIREMESLWSFDIKDKGGK